MARNTRKKKQVTRLVVYMPRDEAQRLRLTAIQQHRAYTHVMRDAINLYVTQKEVVNG